MSLLDTLRDAYDIEDKVLADLKLRDYNVYLRKTTYIGASLDKGLKGTPTVTDTLISPTPKIINASLNWVARSNGYVLAGDIVVYVSANQITSVSDFLNYDGIYYDDKLWKIVQMDAIPDISMPLQWKLLCRKVV